ncbi:MAG: cbb3-type cytochrome oxidase assembly protein [Deltaproteobacteria bacterium]|jgi:cbb3-type cytochrome oxidase maturation protein|nr:cbb3-type cytochrome oxidase assembly protein [Deltaproteobacteria bacterium]MBT4266642.1 cbb3-type cytochrome oxidase assembly protein [Deltaproteobacteria bacterium]MBT4644739.1 cbb3-type cytochrome oxidase assembly protein [Deltaproteobacteria bacterium]MBT6503033.1 cbb3-type cytochrome oxidase assembly protein [Deltaproteobacteria bacterium]MBT6615450.1 cbb3-type cytochrome oxidase assembly protein [Deltaproteobacteria bacterium]
MYYPFFLTYILTGVIIALVVFIWALKNGQFSDQQRARFLAIEDEEAAVVDSQSKGKYELVLIFFLVVAGIASSFALVAYALLSN